MSHDRRSISSVLGRLFLAVGGVGLLALALGCESPEGSHDHDHDHGSGEHVHSDGDGHDHDGDDHDGDDHDNEADHDHDHDGDDHGDDVAGLTAAVKKSRAEVQALTTKIASGQVTGAALQEAVDRLAELEKQSEALEAKLTTHEEHDHDDH